jgi:hypothetical protein
VSFVISTVLGIALYELSIKEPELTYAMNPDRQELDRPTFDQAFSFSYEGKPIDSNIVCIAEVAIWNNGKQSIKPTDILAPIALQVENGCKIVSVKIKRKSRDLCKIVASPPIDIGFSHTDLSWNILEHLDGCTIQIIYIGMPSAKITLTGAVEGQKAIALTMVKTGLDRSDYVQLFVVLIVLGSFILTGIHQYKRMKYHHAKLSFDLCLSFATQLFSGLALTYLLLHPHFASPPTGW